MSLQTALLSIQNTLEYIAPTISVILIILGAFAYGYSYLQPSDQRGKYINIAIGAIVGGIVIAAIVGGAHLIVDNAKTLLQ